MSAQPSITADYSFSIASEMRDPHLYGRATIYANVLITCVDIMVAVIVYYYCGQYVASPSPGSAGPLLKKVVYGIALPGICISTVIYTHVSIPGSFSADPEDGRKVPLRPSVARQQAFGIQHLAALGDLVLMHDRRHTRRIHRRQRYPYLQLPGIPHRCLLWPFGLDDPDGNGVALG